MGGVVFGTGDFCLNKEVEDLAVGIFNKKRTSKEKTNEYHQNIRRNLITNVKEIRGKWTVSKGIGKTSKADIRLMVRYCNRKGNRNLPKDPGTLRARLEKKGRPFPENLDGEDRGL